MFAPCSIICQSLLRSNPQLPHLLSGVRHPHAHPHTSGLGETWRRERKPVPPLPSGAGVQPWGGLGLQGDGMGKDPESSCLPV